MDATIRIPSTVLEKVKKVLEYNACCVSADLTPLEDITLAKGVTPKQFQQWASRNEEIKTKQWGLKIEYMDGRIIATELAGRGHAFAAGRLVLMLGAQDPNHDLEYGIEEDVDFPQGQQYKADVTVNIRGNYNGPLAHLVNLSGGYFPSVIIEIGVAQSTPDLCRKLNFYSTIPSIQIYIAIKRFSTDGMVAMRFDRANNWQPVSIISFGLVPLHPIAAASIQGNWNQPITGVGFGGPACNGPNLQEYVISLPSNVIFLWRQGGVPAAVPATFDIDLFRMQEVLGL